MSRGNMLAESTYDQIKRITHRGVSNKEIAGVFGLSEYTISRIKTSESYDDYRQRRQEASYKYKNSTKQNDESTISIMYSFNRIYQELQKQTELLERMLEQWKA